MALLQVRNFPDDLYEEIGRIAQAERRTIAQQTVLMVERALESASKTEKRRDALQRTLSRDLPAAMIGADALQMIRDDRAR